MGNVLKRTIRGIRDSIPAGYIMGRLSANDGPAELIPLKSLALATAAVMGTNPATGAGTAADFGLFFSGKPNSAQLLFEMVLTKTILLPAGLAGSKFDCRVVPTADYTVTLSKNGASIGTIKFAASTGATTITVATDTTFAIGDKFKIVGPTADSTLEDVSFSFAALFV